MIDNKNLQQKQAAEHCLHDLFDLVIMLQGSLSGEHGVGRSKLPYIDKELSATHWQLMKQIKQQFDPNNLFCGLPESDR